MSEEFPWEDEGRLRDFAEAYVETGNAVTALQRARVQNPQFRAQVWAGRLLARSDVRGFIAECEARPRRERVFTRESLAEDFQEVYERALSEGDYSPAVTAKAKQAELLGMMEKNVRISVSTSVKDMSMEDLERELARLKDEGVLLLEQSGVADDGTVIYE